LSPAAGQRKIKGFVEFTEWMFIENTAEIVIRFEKVAHRRRGHRLVLAFSDNPTHKFQLTCQGFFIRGIMKEFTQRNVKGFHRFSFGISITADIQGRAINNLAIIFFEFDKRKIDFDLFFP